METDTPTKSPEVSDSQRVEACAAPVCSLLDWADENIAQMEYQTYPIADTGDYSETYEVRDHYGRASWGNSYREALEQAKMDDNDPRRMDYVPEEFRYANKQFSHPSK
jgi:hypothetical protein